MAWVWVFLSSVAAVLMHRTGHVLLMAIAIFAAVGCFWSWGVMHNFATELAKQRRDYSGRFYDITPGEAQSVPDFIAGLNMIFSLAGLGLFIAGVLLAIAAR